MSLEYNIDSPLEVKNSTLSEVSFDSTGGSVNLLTPSGLSSTYNFVLPPYIGSQNQLLTLNSSLETEWVSNVGNLQSFSASDTITFSGLSGSYILVPSMTLTPPAGKYYAIFNSYGFASSFGSARDLEYAFSVGGVVIPESFRIVESVAAARKNLITTQIITLNGSETIEVVIRSIGNFSIFERILLLYKVV